MEEEVKSGPLRKVMIIGEPDELGLHQTLADHAAGLGGWEVKTLYTDSIAYKQVEVMQQLHRFSPELVICLGQRALGTLVPGIDRNSSGTELRAKTFVWQDADVRFIYNNDWIAKHRGPGSREWAQAMTDVTEYLSVGVQAKRFEYELFEPHQYKEFLAKFMDAPVLGLDYEGSSLEPTVEGFEIGGIGLARKGYAAYLCFKDFGNFEYRFTPEIANTLGRFLKAKNDQNALLAFNLKYEVPITKTHMHRFIDRVIDVMQECRTLDIRGGLKEISKQLLHVSGWTKGLEEWLEAVNKLLAQLKPTSRAPRAEEKFLREGGIAAVHADLLKRQAKTEEKTPGKTNARIEAMLESIASFREMAVPIYGADTDAKITAFLIHKMDRGEFDCNYTEIPKEITGPYCGADCHNTLEVHEIVGERLDKANLRPAADYYNRQIYLGAAMEENGIMWDDDVAEELDVKHKKVMMDALRAFILCPGVWARMEVEDGDEVRRATEQDKLNVLSTTELDHLKGYFNPGSTAPANTIRLGEILVTPLVRITMMLQDINNQYLSNAEDCLVAYPILTRLMLATMKEKDTGRAAINRFMGAFKIIKENGQLNGGEENLFRRYAGYKLPNAQSETLQIVMDSLINFTGFDFDDTGTWIDDAQPVYYYKLYKKVAKAADSFINGVAGRKSVRIVQLNEETGVWERKAIYGERKPTANERYLFEPSYGVNAAKTKRWTSAYHGIPSMSESKQAFVSRFKNGVGFKCDFSQHELRIIASICKDPNMIQAFVENRDLHKLVATKLYNKEEADITDNERAVAKAANFGLVYLKTEETFAQEYMGGDVAGARRVFRAIFDTFPLLESWRNECIAGMRAVMDASTSDFVSFRIDTLWGDPIIHEFNKSKKMEVIDAERYSVNWRVQSTASNLAALALAESDRFLTANHHQTKAFGFTHDCEEFDAHPDELFLMLTKIPEISEQYLFKEFGLPVKIDVEVGQNLGSLVEFKRLKGENTFMFGESTARGTLDGAAADIEAFIANLREAGYRVEEGTAKDKQKKVSGKDLFSIKGCWHSGIGQTQTYRAVDVELSR